MGNGSNYADAYFEVSHIRAYTTGVEGVAPTAAFAKSPISTSGAESCIFRPVSARAEWVAMAWISIVMSSLFGILAVL